MSELRYWLWLSALTGVRPRVKQELIGRYGGARELFFSPIDELKGDGLLTEEEREALSARRLDAALNIIERCEQEGIGILTIQDAAYPRRLAAIYDPAAGALCAREAAIDRRPGGGGRGGHAPGDALRAENGHAHWL